MRKLSMVMIVACFAGLVYLSKFKLPMIMLPKAMQHNTIGELPFVEVMDDGDFYEVDGAEQWSYYNLCVQSLQSQCKDNIKCKEDSEKLCRDGKNGVPSCQALKNLGDLYYPNVGIFFTCDIGFKAVFPDKEKLQ